MKKTFTANIAGTVFHIEEDAYEQLQRYLAGIRANFSGSAGAEEIMADIEARVAELFNERLQGRNVVSLADVEYIQGIMGTPEDIAGEDPGKDTSSAQAAPPPPLERKHKRLFRDPEDKWIGGVLGGLGNYIGMDPLWLRIGIIALIYFSVGSVIPIYLLMWILVPRAETAAEKLEMRGEPVTVENIKRVFDEGAEKFKQGGARMAEEARAAGKEWGPRAEAWGKEASYRAGSAGRSAASIIGKLVGLAFIVIAFGLLLSLMTALIGGTFSLWHVASWNSDGMGLLDLGGLLFASKTHALWLAIGVFVLLAVPVIGLFLAGFRLLLNTRTPRWLGWTLSILWFAALVPTIAGGFELAHDFQRENSMRTELSITQPSGDVLYLDSNDPRDSSGEWGIRYSDNDLDIDLDGMHVEDGTVSGAWANLDVAQSPDSLYHLTVVRAARAHNAKAALDRAAHIQCSFKQEGDALFVSPVIRYAVEEKLRAQDAHFILQVPLGKSVFFRPGSKHVIYDIDNVTNTLDRDMIGRAWLMTPQGLEEKGSSPGTEGTDPAAKDTTRHQRVAATVWRGPERRKAPPARRTLATVTREADAGVQFPSLLSNLGTLITL